MSTVFGLIVLAEVLLSLFVIWGFSHEERFIAFEEKIAQRISRRKRTKQKAAKKLRVVTDRRGHDYNAA